MRRIHFSTAILSATFRWTQATIHPANPAQNITWPYYSFKTVNFTPPVLEIAQNSNVHSSALAPGYLFLAPDGATAHQAAPLILSAANGDLIWNGPVTHAFSFGVQQFEDQPVLVWWNGTTYPEPIGRGNGAVYLHDKHYQAVATTTLTGDFVEQVVGATFASDVDLHEIVITPRGTLVVTANNVTTADLRSVGGPAEGWVVEAQVYEIDIASNQVLFHWKSLEHLDELPFNSSHYPLGSEGFTGESQSLAWGYFHINAAHPYEGGYIVSSRYLCSAIALDGKGNVTWRLDGRTGGDFTLVGPNTPFCYQHDIRTSHSSASSVTLHMHDNHNCPIDNNTVPTSGKILHLDLSAKTARLQTRFLNTSGQIYSTAQGNFQPLSNGNVLLGHGWVPVVEEYSGTGEILSTVQFGVAGARMASEGGGFVSLQPRNATLSYRAFKQPWVGCPVAPPDVVVEKAVGGAENIYISWNGATDVEGWEIDVGGASGYGGNGGKGMKRVETAKKKGFETKVLLPATKVKGAKSLRVKPVLKRGSSCQVVQSAVVLLA